ncbi:biotin/lipoyl attachment domain-containing protein [Alkaliphilus metalliredigens QYMF]|uniref:Biotin/lipoyl attachment domain-containing protein n=1 Tax=Alkaliphilus metalliredigens (strain QYMF) TaxID=293826 RepID=A6TT37_ALKMQ|nr:biotin/lipoyl-containing protein [Alkaliphilus metalliredigens]ABR49355.1 biotin/lipoyl attachment domain-containing protein [Alkaliphilus metalliredigens QYMF]ABR50608.1 biotin/lipoyl attachment domain-containing protein [Alkaliphilus metalliredigens QYMF]
MKKFNITVNGASYEVEVEEIKDGSVASAPKAPTAAPVAKPAAPKAAAKTEAKSGPVAGATKVESPMPGNIWKIQVKEGQEVKNGQVLIILEAMKMENEIVAPCDGTVAAIHVSEGASVNGGDALVSLK